MASLRAATKARRTGSDVSGSPASRGPVRTHCLWMDHPYDMLSTVNLPGSLPPGIRIDAIHDKVVDGGCDLLITREVAREDPALEHDRGEYGNEGHAYQQVRIDPRFAFDSRSHHRGAMIKVGAKTIDSADSLAVTRLVSLCDEQ